MNTPEVSAVRSRPTVVGVVSRALASSPSSTRAVVKLKTDGLSRRGVATNSAATLSCESGSRPTWRIESQTRNRAAEASERLGFQLSTTVTTLS